MSLKGQKWVIQGSTDGFWFQLCSQVNPSTLLKKHIFKLKRLFSLKACKRNNYTVFNYNTKLKKLAEDNKKLHIKIKQEHCFVFSLSAVRRSFLSIVTRCCLKFDFSPTCGRKLSQTFAFFEKKMIAHIKNKISNRYKQWWWSDLIICCEFKNLIHLLNIVVLVPSGGRF